MKMPKSHPNNVNKSITLTDKMDLSGAEQIYAETTRAACIWNTHTQMIVKSWKPFYNIYNVEAQFREYAFKFRI